MHIFKVLSHGYAMSETHIKGQVTLTLSATRITPYNKRLTHSRRVKTAKKELFLTPGGLDYRAREFPRKNT